MKEELKLINVIAIRNCKSTSVSKAKVNGMRINEIMERRCWKSESTFKKFYDKDIIDENNLDSIMKQILQYYLILIKVL